MTRNAPNAAKLSANETLIVTALRKAARPLSAYDLIELLRDHGVSSPPTVYRALKRLVAFGVAHRIESMNAFISCAHGGHASSAAFAICGTCGGVHEFHPHEAVNLLTDWAHGQAFAITATTIELRGTCGGCTAGQRGQ
jgi:Fur family transcriptional regulator, zinc uptake regulator